MMFESCDIDYRLANILLILLLERHLKKYMFKTWSISQVFSNNWKFETNDIWMIWPVDIHLPCFVQEQL